MLTSDELDLTLTENLIAALMRRNEACVVVQLCNEKLICHTNRQCLQTIGLIEMAKMGLFEKGDSHD